MKMKGRKCLGIRKGYAILLGSALVLQSLQSRAQQANGQGGISAANQQVGSYFDIGCTLMYSIGAIVGLIGAVKVYQKWSHGDHDTSKVAAAWFGACIFLVVVAAILKGFFGVQ